MIELLKPYKINSNKLRLGPDEDGGYVASTVSIDNSKALFTYGVGYDIRYEEAYRSKTGNDSYLYDHTIGRDNGWNIGPQLNFYNEGLGFQDRCDDFINHYSKLNIDGDVLLKIDIEGAEYDYFEKVNVEKLSKITTGILLELHWVSDTGYQERAKNILENLYKYFTLTHIHGNAWGALFEYKGHKVPETFELSLVNNKYITDKEIDNQNYPIEGLDVSNRPSYPDVDLSFLNKL